MLIPKAAVTPSYDADGNLTNDGVFQYTWDAENRMIAIEPTDALRTAYPSEALKVRCTYDYKGRRIWKRVQVWSTGLQSYTDTGGSGQRFLYDGWNVLAVVDNTKTNLLSSYVWGLDLSATKQGAGGVGGLLGINTVTNGYHFTAYDGNGNLTALVNATNGVRSAEYEYSPFGELIRCTGEAAKSNPFRFSTKFYDDETGLSYYGYRFYNASAGRWLSRDPIGEQGGKNVYGFVENNPRNFIDALGRKTCELKIIAGHYRSTLKPTVQNQTWDNYPAGNAVALVGCGANTLHKYITLRNKKAVVPGVPENEDDQLPEGELLRLMQEEGLPLDDLADEDEIADTIDRSFQAAKNHAYNLCNDCCCQKVKITVSCDTDATVADRRWRSTGQPKYGKSTTLSCSSSNFSMMR